MSVNIKIIIKVPFLYEKCPFSPKQDPDPRRWRRPEMGTEEVVISNL